MSADDSGLGARSRCAAWAGAAAFAGHTVRVPFACLPAPGPACPWSRAAGSALHDPEALETLRATGYVQ